MIENEIINLEENKDITLFYIELKKFFRHIKSELKWLIQNPNIDFLDDDNYRARNIFLNIKDFFDTLSFIFLSLKEQIDINKEVAKRNLKEKDANNYSILRYIKKSREYSFHKFFLPEFEKEIDISKTFKLYLLDERNKNTHHANLVYLNNEWEYYRILDEIENNTNSGMIQDFTEPVYFVCFILLCSLNISLKTRTWKKKILFFQKIIIKHRSLTNTKYNK